MDIKFKNRCNGESFGVPDVGAEAAAAVVAVLPRARDEFRDWLQLHLRQESEDKYMLGLRFKDDGAVIGRLRGQATDAEILADPRAWALDALRDCASTDHYYTYEKDYGEE